MGKFSTRGATLSIVFLGIFVLADLPAFASIRQLLDHSFTGVKGNDLLGVSWGDIWNKLRRKKSSGGSRGEESEKKTVCLLVPGRLYDRHRPDNDGRIEIWSDRPLFLWQGTLRGIEVRNSRSNELMWTQALKPTEHSITYAGKPLQPGQVYFWRETRPLEELPLRVSFRLMKAEERQQIKEDLEKLEKKFREERASAEIIALTRINYFAERGLWTDALREIYLNANLFTTQVTQIQDYDFCKKDEQNVS